jgi:hypothetical protein
MPQIFIDGQEHTIEDTQAKGTVGKLLAALVTTLGSSQRMICEVTLNGVSITEESLPDVAQRESATARSLVLKTMMYQELARLGIERANLLLQQVILETTQSAGSFRSASQEEANRHYAVCLEDLQLAVDMVEQLLKLQEGSGNAGNHQHRESMRILLDQLATITGELLSAHRRSDAMVLADVLTYELAPLLHQMQRTLQTLRNPAVVA